MYSQLGALSLEESQQPVGDTKTQFFHLDFRLWTKKTDGFESPTHHEFRAVTKMQFYWEEIFFFA